MNHILGVLTIMLTIVASGCGWAPMAGKEVITESIAIRRCVVGNDWVLSKQDNVLYARYVPGKGVGPIHMLKGNPALLRAIPPAKRPGFLARVLKGPFDGKVVKWNTAIKVYGNYDKAKAANPTATISPESVALIPKKRVVPEWWTKRRLEKE